MNPWMALAGGGLGLANGIMAKNQENRDKDLQANTAKYSQFTGLKPKDVPTANPLSSIIGGIGTGIGLGQSIDSANTFNDWLKSKMGMKGADMAAGAVGGSALGGGLGGNRYGLGADTSAWGRLGNGF